VRETVSALKETGRAAKIEFISKEKALEIYRQRNAGDPLLLELVGANTLPASLEISAVNVTDLPLLYEVAKKAPNIEEIAYQKDIVNSLIRVTRALRSGGAVFLGFLVATALLTILTIIGMKIALRREEIAVEKLVGASAWYIRLPFLMEGFFYGAAGTVLSSAALAIVIFLALPAVSGYLAPLGLTAISPLFWLITGLGAVMISGLIGTTASFLAVWRYLEGT
jgi:cell division transport system permease protein